jgi:uncharacterized protein YodC (DUF2158 family)
VRHQHTSSDGHLCDTSKMPRRRFPISRLWWRLIYSTEESLTSLPLAVVAPTSAALAGTAWAVSHTPELVVHNGRVVDTESFGHALLNGVAGGVFGLVVVIVLVFVAVWLRYRVLGDPNWQSAFIGQDGDMTHWQLQRRPGSFPADPKQLGGLTLGVRVPSGPIQENSLVFSQVKSTPEGPSIWVATGGDAGSYEARWYSGTHGKRLREVARGKVQLNGSEDRSI